MRALTANAFFVLGLAPTASAMEVERAARKLTDMLEIGMDAARSYDTPLGPRERTAQLVRDALAALRDPATRLLHELWASVDPAELAEVPSTDRDTQSGEPDVRGGEPKAPEGHARGSATAAAWPDALAALGWRRN